jgi:predicted metal-dependent hydrolase
MKHFNAGRFFPAHEAWETAWKQARGTPDEEFFKGLSQLGAGYVHYRRGNPHGARTLIRRALSRVSRYGPRHHGVDVTRLAGIAEGHARAFEEAEQGSSSMPSVDPPTI